MASTITVIWKRGSKAESEPTLSAYKKEDDVKTYMGTPIAGGRKFVIPDNEENQGLVDSLDGKKWSVRNTKKPKSEK